MFVHTLRELAGFLQEGNSLLSYLFHPDLALFLKASMFGAFLTRLLISCSQLELVGK
jgi:hypothetical protein